MSLEFEIPALDCCDFLSTTNALPPPVWGQSQAGDIPQGPGSSVPSPGLGEQRLCWAPGTSPVLQAGRMDGRTVWKSAAAPFLRSGGQGYIWDPTLATRPFPWVSSCPQALGCPREAGGKGPVGRDQESQRTEPSSPTLVTETAVH